MIKAAEILNNKDVPTCDRILFDPDRGVFIEVDTGKILNEDKEDL
jgi:hypothetical protein